MLWAMEDRFFCPCLFFVLRDRFFCFLTVLFVFLGAFFSLFLNPPDLLRFYSWSSPPPSPPIFMFLRMFFFCSSSFCFASWPFCLFPDRYIFFVPVAVFLSLDHYFILFYFASPVFFLFLGPFSVSCGVPVLLTRLFTFFCVFCFVVVISDVVVRDVGRTVSPRGKIERGDYGPCMPPHGGQHLQHHAADAERPGTGVGPMLRLSGKF